MERDAARRLNERGDLSAYLAAGMLLPLLLLIAGGGAQTLALLSDRQSVMSIGYGGLREAEMTGGVTPALQSSLAATLHLDVPRLQAVTISGTTAGTAWGGSVCLNLSGSEVVSMPFLSQYAVPMGGQFCGVSDLPPNP